MSHNSKCLHVDARSNGLLVRFKFLVGLLVLLAVTTAAQLVRDDELSPEDSDMELCWLSGTGVPLTIQAGKIVTCFAVGADPPSGGSFDCFWSGP